MAAAVVLDFGLPFTFDVAASPGPGKAIPSTPLSFFVGDSVGPSFSPSSERIANKDLAFFWESSLHDV